MPFKKHHMRQILYLFLISTFLTSCQNCSKQNDKSLNSQIVALQNVLDRFGSNPQRFVIDSKTENVIITKGGIRIKLNPNCLETTDNNLIGDSVELIITECFNQIDFIKYNVQTIDQCGSYLVSGGAFNISLNSNSHLLKIKNNCAIELSMSVKSDNEMELFYGIKDDNQQILWQQAKKKFKKALRLEIEKDISDISKDNIGYYDPVKLDKLGWINCDRFIEVKEKIKVDFKLQTKRDTLVSKALLIFKDINSVTSKTNIMIHGKTDDNYFANVPINMKLRLVGYCLINDSLKGFSCDFISKSDTVININFSDITEDKLNEIVNKK